MERKLKNNEILPSQDGSGRRLVVTFHGFGGPARMRRVVDMVRADMPDCDIFTPLYPFYYLRIKHPASIAAHIVACLDEQCADKDYEDIIFISYSMGATIARKVLIGGWGQVDELQFEPEFAIADNQQRNWHRSVSRIVNIAGMTRGWVVSSRQQTLVRIAFNFFGVLGHIIPGYMPSLFRLRRGAPFIVDMRLQWLSLMHRSAEQRPQLLIVNLLGSDDSLVGPIEVIDFVGATAGDSRVCFIQVPESDHRSIVEVQPWSPPKIVSNWRSQKERVRRHDVRGEALRTAIVGTEKDVPVPEQPFKNPPAGTIDSIATPQANLNDDLPASPNYDVEHLVFIIHGIRDDGYWTKKVAGKIKSLSIQVGTTIASNTSSYGYFTAVPFILPWVRRQKVEWLMDLYATARAIHPNAKFSYVGHSNGTYLAAYALENYQSCVFDKIVFAGSVVRKNYDWKSKFEGKYPKVGCLLNYVATNDKVVAFFTKGLQPFKFFNLGSAGHDGFTDEQNCPQHIKQVRYVVGGHSAGRGEAEWDTIAEFIVNGTAPDSSSRGASRYSDRRSALTFLVGSFSTVLLFMAIALLATIGWALFTSLVDVQWSASASPLTMSWLSNFSLADWYSGFAAQLDHWWNRYNELHKGWNIAIFVSYFMILRHLFFKH